MADDTLPTISIHCLSLSSAAKSSSKQCLHVILGLPASWMVTWCFYPKISPQCLTIRLPTHMPQPSQSPYSHTICSSFNAHLSATSSLYTQFLHVLWTIHINSPDHSQPTHPPASLTLSLSLIAVLMLSILQRNFLHFQWNTPAISLHHLHITDTFSLLPPPHPDYHHQESKTVSLLIHNHPLCLFFRQLPSQWLTKATIHELKVKLNKSRYVDKVVQAQLKSCICTIMLSIENYIYIYVFNPI